MQHVVEMPCHQVDSFFSEIFPYFLLRKRGRGLSPWNKSKSSKSSSNGDRLVSHTKIAMVTDIPDIETTGGAADAMKAFVVFPRALPLPAGLIVWGVGDTAAFPRPFPLEATSRAGCGAFFPTVFG